MKYKTCSLVILFTITFFLTSVSAGTITIGIKGWYAWWDPAFGEIVSDENGIFNEAVEKNIDSKTIFTDTTATSSGDTKTGHGYLAGPIFNYQTDNRLWSVSISFMIMNSFKQEGTINSQYTSTYVPMAPLKVHGSFTADQVIELERKEIDCAVTRSCYRFIKLFAGYKYLSMDTNFSYYVTSFATYGPPVGYEYDIYSISLKVHAPSIGAGVMLPLTDNLFTGIQLGVLYIIPDAYYTITTYGVMTTEKSNLNFENTFGFNGEASLSYLIGSSIIIQAGYRYQSIKLKTDDTRLALNEWDTFHGVTASVMYMISI